MRCFTGKKMLYLKTLISKFRVFVMVHRKKGMIQGVDVKAQEKGTPQDVDVKNQSPMDDADLEKLVCKPGKLKPKFNRNHTDYEILLNSGVHEFKVDPLTRDSNASWTIADIGTQRTISITEGKTIVLTIEVTAEDGSIKKYNVKVISLSSSTAVITTLLVKGFTIRPAFILDIFNYECEAPFHQSTVQVQATSPDKNTTIEVVNSENGNIELNVGVTNVEVLVTSPDGTESKSYKISICKQRFLFSLQLSGLMCSICHCVLHVPATAMQHPVLFCHECLKCVTRTNKVHPFTSEALIGENVLVRDDVEDKISSSKLKCPFECGNDVIMKELGRHVKEDCANKFFHCDKTDTVVFGKTEDVEACQATSSCTTCSRVIPSRDLEFHQKDLCSETFDFVHKVVEHSWQKKYEATIIAQEYPDPVASALKCEQEYFVAIENRDYEASLKSLEKASQLYSHAISVKSSDPYSHFRLGVVLEEIHMVQDLYGVTLKSPLSKSDDDEGEFQTDESMEDDIKSLAEQRGFGKNASTTNQLKALDQEYHFLLDQGQSEKADYVQKLYAFKQKQQHQKGGGASVAHTSETYLGKAFLKYFDAASLGKKEPAYQLHAGRAFLRQGKLQEAIERFQHALLLKPAFSISKFFLGIALLQSNNSQKELGMRLLEDEFSSFVYHLQIAEHHNSKMIMMAENFPSTKNILVIQGLLDYAKLLTPALEKTRLFKQVDLYNFILLFCFDVVITMVNRGEFFINYLSLLFETLYEYGLKLTVVRTKQEMADYWQSVSNLTNSFGSMNTQHVLSVQRKICESSLYLLPRSSQALNHMGEILYTLLDSTPSQVNIEDVVQCFRSSIELEDKNIHEGEPTDSLKNTKFWKEHVEKKNEKKKTEVVEKKPTGSNTQGKTTQAEKVKGAAVTSRRTSTGPAATGRATKITVGRTSTKPVATGRGRQQSVTKPTPASTKVLPPTKKTAGEKISSKSSLTKCNSKSKVTSPRTSKISTSPTKEKAVTTEKTEPIPTLVELNKPSHISRIGLARVLNRANATEHLDEIIQLYNDAIKMAPEVHDSYIELGEILNRTKPLEAVDVYTKFPFSAEPSYDDAFLYGEIVRILMKAELFDDDRLETYLIALGRVLGFTSLDKYITILESKLKYNKLLCSVYAGVNGKDIDHPDLQAFFKFKFWI